MKICTRCQKEKADQDFRLRKKGKYIYKNPTCKSCDIELYKEYKGKNKDKILERRRLKRRSLGIPERIFLKTKKCKICDNEFIPQSSFSKYCSRECFTKSMKVERLGNMNPAYRNGTRIKGKQYSSKHLRACAKYRRAFLEKNGYVFCESCGVNQSLRFETHHIIYASEAPKHTNLHNPRNLVLVCIKCHNNFHKHKSLRADLVKTRKLYELFPDHHL